MDMTHVQSGIALQTKFCVFLYSIAFCKWHIMTGCTY